MIKVFSTSNLRETLESLLVRDQRDAWVAHPFDFLLTYFHIFL